MNQLLNFKTIKNLHLILLFSMGISSSAYNQTAYIPHNEFEVNQLTVLDLPTSTIVATIEICNRGSSIAISPDESKVFVGCSEAMMISVIETANNTVVETLEFDNLIDGLSMSHDGEKLYVSHSNEILILDANTYEELDLIMTNGGLPLAPVETYDGSKLYFPNHYGNSVGVYDLQSNEFVTDIDLLNPYSPTAVAISQDDNTVWVVSDGIITKIDATTNTVIEDFFFLSTFFTDLTLHPDGTKLYTVDTYGGLQSLYVISTETGELLETIPLGDHFEGIDISPDGKLICVTSINGDKVSIIDAITSTVVSTNTITPRPNALGEFIMSTSFISGVDILTNVPGIISVSPNPALDHLLVSFENTPSNPTSFVLYNSLGQKIKSGNIETGVDVQSINISAITKGTYILAIHGEDWSLNKRLIVGQK